MAFKLLVLGTGHIGRAIAHLLVTADGQPRLPSDCRRPAGRAGRAPQFETLGRVRCRQSPPSSACWKATTSSSMPCRSILPAAWRRPRREARAHYFDLTEDLAATRTIRNLPSSAPTVLMPQCGLAPGFIGIAGYALSQGFDRLERLHMRVGALAAVSRPTPSSTTSPGPWTGLINEYCHPCEAIVDGQRIDVPPLEGYETFALDGVHYEAFNTSGGLGTLAETLEGKVSTWTTRPSAIPATATSPSCCCRTSGSPASATP